MSMTDVGRCRDLPGRYNQDLALALLNEMRIYIHDELFSLESTKLTASLLLGCGSHKYQPLV